MGLKKLPKIDQPLVLSNGHIGLNNATMESVTDGIRLHDYLITVQWVIKMSEY